MKKITTFLFCMFFMLGVVKAQDITVFNFDGVTPTTSSWSDSFTSNTNPISDGVNSSANVGKYTHSNAWSNVTLTSPVLSIDSRVYPLYEMSIYSPAAGNVVIALYNAANTQLEWYNQSVSVSAGWNKITHTLPFVGTVTKVVVMFNYGGNPAGNSNDAVYLDNLVFKHIDYSLATVFNFDGVTPTFTYAWWGDTFQSIANPLSDAVNSSANVGKYTHNNQWDNGNTATSVDIDPRVYNSYEICVYSPSSTTGKVQVKCMDASNNQLDWYEQTITTAGSWIKLTHNLNFTRKIAKIQLFFNNGSAATGGGSVNDIVYFDNLVFKKSASTFFTLYSESFWANWSQYGSWSGAPTTKAGQWFGGVDLQTVGDATINLDRWWNAYEHTLKLSQTDADVIIPNINVIGFDSLKLSFEVTRGGATALPVVAVKVGTGDWVSVTTSNTDSNWGFSGNAQVDLLKDAGGNPISNVSTISIRLSASPGADIYYDNVKVLGKLHYQFTGGTSTDPTVSTNWLGGFIPESTNDLTISGTLVLDLNATYNTITVNPAAKLTLSNTKSLTASSLLLKSDATGTATFVDYNTTPATISATVQQYLPETDRNWYVSSPVASATNGNLATGASVVEYNEQLASWTSVSGTLNPMKGYISTSGSAGTGTINFSGNLNSGPKSVVLSNKGATKNGFNLVGNPYPSYLLWTQALANSANCLTTIWYRTKSAGVYSFQTYNASGDIGVPLSTTGYIPPMQAFWVRTTVDGSTLAVDNTMRYHGNGSSNLLKAPAAKNGVNPLVRLQVSNGANSDETVIYFNPNADNGFDSFDSPKMSANNASIPEIYTTAGTEPLVINGMNTIAENTVIPLGFGTGTSSDFTLAATELKNIESGMHIILKDNLLRSETDLSEGWGNY
jgi:hypothetical protein